MENYERIEMLEEASAMIEGAIQRIIEATTGSEEEATADAYTVPHLNTWVQKYDPSGGFHQSGSIDSMIYSLRKMTTCNTCGDEVSSDDTENGNCFSCDELENNNPFSHLERENELSETTPRQHRL